MSTPSTIKNQLSSLVTQANTVTGENDATVTDAVESLIEGYGNGGITPSGTLQIGANGTHNVSEYEFAEVNVPSTGITPTGTKEITQNGTYDVTTFANVLVNVPGSSFKIYDVDIATDQTSAVDWLTNDWLKSIRSNANAFVLLRAVGDKSSIACIHTVLTANFPLYYSGTTIYNSLVLRSTTTTGGTNANTHGLNQNGGEQYSGHLNIDTNGRLWSVASTTYPIKSGKYLIIAGLME